MTDPAEPIPAAAHGHDALGIALSASPTESAIRLCGELDHTTVAVLRGAIEGQLADGHRRIVVDVAGLRFVDAAGFRTLRAAQDLAVGLGGCVVVVGYDAFFAELARICDAEDVLGPV